jgi:pimeloyl-ACP methyl ester carboxylesterase
LADREGVILLAPTFQATKSEIENRKGYYYPAEWSGGVLLRALDELRRRTGCETDTVFLCGHSAGAHFAHRFAIWRPDRVAAFAAYSAAWWDEPTAEMKQVPALIMCGEADLRYETTLEFLQRGLAQDSPWVWRGYAATGHEMTPAVQRMAAVFLEHYLRGERDEPFVGDLQTYDVLPWAEREEIPEVARVRLPSRKVAETWRLED